MLRHILGSPLCRANDPVRAAYERAAHSIRQLQGLNSRDRGTACRGE